LQHPYFDVLRTRQDAQADNVALAYSLPPLRAPTGTHLVSYLETVDACAKNLFSKPTATNMSLHRVLTQHVEKIQ